MIDNRFEEGQKVESVFWSDGEYKKVGTNKCKRITVVMENGQLAGVPWFLAEFEDSPDQKYNGAMLEGVTLLDKS